MRWVTREWIGVDRMACAWLIAKFVDGEAEFAFVPERAVPAAEDGEAFDMPGVRLSHHRGRATFHAILREYGIADTGLHRLARLIDEADTVQETTLEPGAFGLDMICRGIRKVCRDDAEALQRSAPVFDGLYALLSEEAGA